MVLNDQKIAPRENQLWRRRRRKMNNGNGTIVWAESEIDFFKFSSIKYLVA